VKPAIDIILKTIHLGNCKRVVTLDINGKDRARKFLEKLKKDDGRKWKLLANRIGLVSNFNSYENDQVFNYLEDGIYEFKRPGLRLYAFYDELGDEHQLILCTNGGTKNTKKEQQSDIDRAKSIKADYFTAKSNPEASFTIKEAP
jgi:hypothetical protein